MVTEEDEVRDFREDDDECLLGLVERKLRARIHYHRRRGNISTLADCRAKLKQFCAEFDEDFHEDTVVGAIRVRVCGLDLFYSLRESSELYGYAQAGSVGGQWQGGG